MKKLIYFGGVTLFFSVTGLSMLTAQGIGIGTTTPHSSAMLDVTNPNKGLLIPRVALTGTNDVTTIPSPAVSLLVYNTATAGGVSPGYHYWNGNTWLMLSTGGGGSGNAWSLTGNTGTVDGTNFIGTIDFVPLNIRVNNNKAGRIDPALANTFWGYMAGNSTSTGLNNTAMGYTALFSNTMGNSNTANGYKALNSNTTGSRNSAFGHGALSLNLTGTNNTAFGYNSLSANTGHQNTAFGTFSLLTNTFGENNTGIGLNALRENTSGSYNTSTGYSSLQNNETSIFNTANFCSSK